MSTEDISEDVVLAAIKEIPVELAQAVLDDFSGHPEASRCISCMQVAIYKALQKHPLQQVTDHEDEVERFAKALWLAKESKRTVVALCDEPAREWEAYAKGEENYDVGRFEYDRDDHRYLARKMLELLKCAS